MSEEEKKPVGKIEINERKIIHSEDAPRYYANNTEIGMTSYDISLKFALIDRSDSEGLHLKDQAIITMSLHHAKAVARILDVYIRQFEQQHGPLSIPGILEPGDIPTETVIAKLSPDS